MKRLALSSIVLLFLFLFSSKRISTTDMEASVPKGTFGWFWQTPLQRGQIVLIDNPLDKQQQRLVRIIATEGQRVAFQNGSFLVDEIRIQQTDMGANGMTHRVFKETIWFNDQEYSWLINTPNEAIDWNLPELLVPAGQIFVACDNRSSCLDSRWWGSIPSNSIHSTLRVQLNTPDKFHPFFYFYPSISH